VEATVDFFFIYHFHNSESALRASRPTVTDAVCVCGAMLPMKIANADLKRH
jgi:hypothetical protein